MITKEILEKLNEYIYVNLIISDIDDVYLFEKSCSYNINLCSSKNIDLPDSIQTDLSFSETLFTYIDNKKIKDSEVYKKAGIDRKLFSKIRTIDDYHPRKTTIIALALALELDEENTNILLESAGYILSKSKLLDVIIMFCINNGIYNLNEVNEVLYSRNLKPL